MHPSVEVSEDWEIQEKQEDRQRQSLDFLNLHCKLGPGRCGLLLGL